MTKKELDRKIRELDKKYHLNIASRIAGKKGFERISCLCESFKEFKSDFENTKRKFLDFFAGKIHEKIEVDFPLDSTVPLSFKEITDVLMRGQKLSADQEGFVFPRQSDMIEYSVKGFQFYFENLDDFNKYREFFTRIEENWGFGDEEKIYMTYSEFKEKYDEINQMGRNDFIAWYRAKQL